MSACMLLWTVALLSLPLVSVKVARAQSDSARLGGFLNDLFNKRAMLAAWLYRYDRCAWITTDSLIAEASPAERDRLGGQWLCYEDGDTWHAIYGAYDVARDDATVVFQFAQRGVGYARVPVAPPAETLPEFRAIAAVERRVAGLMDSTGLRLNIYVRPEPPGPVIWVLPAWQPDGRVVFDMELRFAFDSSGRVLRDSTLEIEPIRAALPDSTTDLAINADQLTSRPSVRSSS